MGQQVSVFGIRMPVKSAKTAAGLADIGVIDIAIDHKSHPTLRMQTAAHAIGHPPQSQ